MFFVIMLWQESRSQLYSLHTFYIESKHNASSLALHPNSQTPVKKSKLHPLSREQKISNRALSRKCILIENIICRLKIFRIMSEGYRNRRKRFALRFNLIAAICNMEH
jgi:hypothetical protein